MRPFFFLWRVFIPLVLSLIPGWGHIWIGRGTTGLMIFMLATAALNFAFLAEFEVIEQNPSFLGRFAAATAAAAWAFSVFDIFRAVVWARTKNVQERRRRRLRKAMAHYLRNERGQAMEEIEAVLRIDPNDPAAWAWLGALHRASGRSKESKRALRRARACDRGGRWRSLMDFELEHTS